MYDTTGIEYYTIPNFTFSTGETLDIKVAYRSFNPSSPKKVLIPTCYGGRINTTLNFTQSALASYHVVVVAMLGHGESSSPSNTPNFPKVLRHQDNVNAQYQLVTQHLGFTSLDAVIGHSMGGQQAYYWAVMHSSPHSPNPSFVKSVVVICASAKTSAINLAFLEGPIAALEASADYANGTYREKGIMPVNGVRAFGRVYAAWLTSPAWFRKGRWRELGFTRLEDFLDMQPPRFSPHDAQDLLLVAHMWRASDVGDIAAGPIAAMEDKEQRWRAALKQIQAKVLLMPSRTDQYFRIEESEEELKVMGELGKNGDGGRAVWCPIETEWGHIAGGGANPEDAEFLDMKIAEFLKDV
ncbi:hypothetical protein CDV55_100179 [Aspergillus turcosus]|nr:hypothetical protein CDV55_100179 [Aspergillus turcosus]